MESHEPLEDSGLKPLTYRCHLTLLQHLMGLSSSFLACATMGRLLKPPAYTSG